MNTFTEGIMKKHITIMVALTAVVYGGVNWLNAEKPRGMIARRKKQW